MTPADLGLALIVMAIGATVQGAAGFGQSLVAVPLLLLIDPGLVPGPAVVAGLALNALMLTRDHGHADHLGLPWAVAGVVPGAVLAGTALALATDQAVAVGSALLILIAVALSLAGLHPRRTPGTLLGAGAASGFMGTAAAIGGPPIALLYQLSGGPALRATLARFFLASGVPTLVVLTVGGHLGTAELGAGLAMVPGIVVGFVASGPLRGHLDPVRTRRVVLAVSAASAVAALLKALVG